MSRLVNEFGGLPFDLSSGPSSAALDLPGVLIDNAIRGRLVEAGLRPSEMSSQDRASIADRVKAQVGDFPLTNALVEVALNPWIWLAVSTSVLFPFARVGKQAVTETFDTIVARHTATNREKQPLLSMIGLLTPQMDLAGTDLLPILNQVNKGMGGFRQIAQDVADARFRLLQSLKNEGVSFPHGTLEDMPDLNRKIQAYLHGLHLDRMETRYVAKLGKDGKELTDKAGVPYLRATEVKAPAILDGRKLTRDLEEAGALEYVLQLRKAYDDGIALIFKTPEGVIDENKVQRVVRGMLTDVDGQQISTLKGTPLEHLFGDDMMEAIASGKIQKEEFADFIRKSIQSKTYYAPLNTSVMYVKEVGGVIPIPPDELSTVLDRYRRTKLATGKYSPAFERELHMNVYDPDELESLRGVGNKNLDGAIKRSKKIRDGRGAEIKNAGIFGMPSLNAERAFDKYLRNSAVNFALHVQQPDELIIAAQKKSRDLIREAHKRGVRKADLPEGHFYDPPVPGITEVEGVPTGVRRSVMETAELGITAAGPAGGYSMYDTLRAGYLTISDSRTQQIMRDAYVPMVLGQISTKRGAMTMGYSWVKGQFKTLMESEIGTAIKQSGVVGEEFHEKMLEWSKYTSRDPLLVDRGVAGYLYGTTLGANPFSVMINMFQPMMMLPRFLDVDVVAKAYGDAFKEMGGYIGLRQSHFAKHGLTRRGMLLGPEFAHEKADIIDKSFRWAREAEIGPSIEDTIDKIGAPITKSARAGVLGAISNTTEFMLKGFEKGEWLNRAVTAHAVVRQGAKQGVKANDQALLNTITRFVDETQFGARALNTPRIFFDPNSYAPFFTNPLFRQFLTFPLRVAVSLKQGTHLGGGGFREAIYSRDPKAAVLASRDMFRAMATSAVMYEVGKEMFGVDMSPGTVIGGAEGIIREHAPLSPFPAPPGVTLPISALKWLSTGDSEAMKYTLPTLVPGGVAFARALGGVPQTPLLGLGVQRTAVDYSFRTPDGRYRVHDNENRTISWETLPAIIARSAGLDFGKFRDEGEMIKFLVGIRSGAIEMRREFLLAMKGGNDAKMRKIAAEFEGKFGMKLQVNDAQIRAFEQSFETSRTERVFQSLPREFKQQFGPAVAQELGGRLGVDPQKFGEALTIKERDPARYYDLDVDRLVPQEARREKSKGPYSPYTPFGQ